MDHWKSSAKKESSREMQGLVCNDVLRDWLRHLKDESGDASEEGLEAAERVNGKRVD